MSSLIEVSSSRSYPLEPDHVVGRAPNCALRLAPRYISAQHALIRWTGHRWEIRDLSSTNGTFVGGDRIDPGSAVALSKGARVAFGSAEELWELADDSPPPVMAVPIQGGLPVKMAGDLLALPSTDDPTVTIYRDVAAGWVLEQPDESVQAIKNGDMFEAVGRWWRFCCAEEASVTTHATAPIDVVVRNLELVFEVSRSEEHVALSVRCHGRASDLGARSRYFLLLTLARRRLADMAEGLPDGECGWTRPEEEWPSDASMAPQQVTLDVFRIRQALAGAGVADFANIIERRAGTHELRIGTANVKIRPA